MKLIKIVMRYEKPTTSRFFYEKGLKRILATVKKFTPPATYAEKIKSRKIFKCEEIPF